MCTQIGLARKKYRSTAETLVEDVGCFEGSPAYFADCPRERTAAHLLHSCGAHGTKSEIHRWHGRVGNGEVRVSEWISTRVVMFITIVMVTSHQFTVVMFHLEN